MKIYLSLIFSLLFINIYSQTVIPSSNLVGDVFSISSVVDSTYLIQVNNINDESDVNYNGTNILANGNFVFWQNCTRYVVTSVSCGTCFRLATSVKVEVTADNSANGPPTFGISSFVEENNGVGGYVSGTGNPDNQCINAYYIGKQLSIVDSLFTSFNIIQDSIWVFYDRFGVELARDTTHLGISGGGSGTPQTLANSSDATSHTVVLSDSGGSITLDEGTNIDLATTGDADNGTVTINVECLDSTWTNIDTIFNKRCDGTIDTNIVVSTASLDAAYNNSGATPKINVDGNGGSDGLELESTGANNITVDLQGTGVLNVEDAGTSAVSILDDGTLKIFQNGADATGTTDQKPSRKVNLENSSWSGSAEVKSVWQMWADSSNTENNYPRFKLNLDGVPTMRIDKSALGFSPNRIGITTLGYDAGTDNTTGFNSLYLGGHAGANNTTGYQNTFVGNRSGVSNTTGYQNTFVGQGSGYYQVDANESSALGFHALYNFVGSIGRNTATGWSALEGAGGIGYGNTATGYQAGRNVTDGINNTFIGASSGLGTTTGSSNVFVGISAGATNSTGSSSTMVGNSSGANFIATGTTNNTFIGVLAGRGTSGATGTSNTCVGASSGLSLSTGYQNIMIGQNAGYATTTGHTNTFIGTQTAFSNTIGIGNVFLGYQSGYTSTAANANTTGSNNTYIGYQAGGASTTQISRATALGYRATVDQNDAVVIGQVGVANVGIGTTTPSSKAILDLTSTTRGFLAPRMTTAQRDAISSPATGLGLYNTTTNFPNFWDGTAWRELVSQTFANSNYFKQGGNSFGATAVLGPDDSNDLQFKTKGATRITIDTTGLVGIGVDPTVAYLEVKGTGSQLALRGGADQAINKMIFVDDGGETGYLGFPSSGNNTMALMNETADGLLVLGTNNTTGITMNTSQEVGIGASPVTGFDLTIANAMRLTGYAIFRGAGSTLTTGGSRLQFFNTVTSDTYDFLLDDVGVFSLYNTLGNRLQEWRATGTNLNGINDGVFNNILDLYHNSATPSDDDYQYIPWYANDSNGNKTEFCRDLAVSLNVTDGAEDGSREFFYTDAGILKRGLQVNPNGITLGNTTQGTIISLMTNTQRDALTPVYGMTIQSSDDDIKYTYNGTRWIGEAKSSTSWDANVAALAGATDTILVEKLGNWSRVDSVVTFSYRFKVGWDFASPIVSFTLDLPIASNFTDADGDVEATVTMTQSDTYTTGLAITGQRRVIANITDDKIQIVAEALHNADPGGTEQRYWVTVDGSYKVK